MTTEPDFDPVRHRFRSLEIEDMEKGFIEISNGDKQGRVILDSEEAIALRNWLNRKFYG